MSAGKLQLGTGGSLASTGALTVNGGTFDLNGNSQAVTTFSGTGGTVTSASAATFTAGDNSTTPATFAGTITGSLAVTKQGTGTLILTGTNTYTGATTIDAGTLQAGADFTLSSSSRVTVNTGAMLDLNNHNNSIGSLSPAAAT